MAGWFILWARSVPLYTWPSDAAATRAYESRSKSASTWLASRSPHSVWPYVVWRMQEAPTKRLPLTLREAQPSHATPIAPGRRSYSSSTSHISAVPIA